MEEQTYSDHTRDQQLHTMTTHLTVIKGYAQLLEREYERPQARPERIRASIQQLQAEVDRLLLMVTGDDDQVDSDALTSTSHATLYRRATGLKPEAD